MASTREKRRKAINNMVSSTSEVSFTASRMLPIEIDDIKIDNIRKDFDEDKIKKLANSIKETDLIEPIVVRRNKDQEFELIAGERRLRAFKLLGRKKISAVIKNVNEEDIALLQFIENFEREELNPIDEADGLKKIMDAKKLTVDELAKVVGKSTTTIYDRLSYLKIAEQVPRDLLIRIPRRILDKLNKIKKKPYLENVLNAVNKIINEDESATIDRMTVLMLIEKEEKSLNEDEIKKKKKNIAKSVDTAKLRLFFSKYIRSINKIDNRIMERPEAEKITKNIYNEIYCHVI